MRIAGSVTVLCVLTFIQPAEAQDSPAVSGDFQTLAVAGGVGLALARPLGRAALSYELRTPEGFIFALEGGLGIWVEDGIGVLGIFAPGVKLELTPRKPSSVFLSGGATILVESGTAFGFNVGAGYDMATSGPAPRFEGRIHIADLGQEDGALYIIELMVAYQLTL